MLYCHLNLILMKPKPRFIFHILLFFMWMAGKELTKTSLIRALYRQLSETPEMSGTIQTENLWNGKSCEIDHQVVKRRWVVIPKVLIVKGLWGKEGHWEQDELQDTVGRRACGCPGPCCLSGPARAGVELSAPRPPLVEKNLLLTTSKEWGKWSEYPDRLLSRGFPEGLTQTNLKASPFPPGLVETFILVPWTRLLKVHTISEYSPIYSLLLQRHLTVTGCFLLTPAKCGIEVWGWGVSTWMST